LTTAISVFSILGTVINQPATTAGGNGGVAAGAALTPTFPTNIGGTGGGGTNTGGNYVAAGFIPALPATAANTSAQHGVILYKPTLILYGGRGGGGGTTGGRGGDGAPGCGGGGGGGGTTSAGNGGKGGNGFVIITTSF